MYERAQAEQAKAAAEAAKSLALPPPQPSSIFSGLASPRSLSNGGSRPTPAGVIGTSALPISGGVRPPPLLLATTVPAPSTQSVGGPDPRPHPPASDISSQDEQEQDMDMDLQGEEADETDVDRTITGAASAAKPDVFLGSGPGGFGRGVVGLHAFDTTLHQHGLTHSGFRPMDSYPRDRPVQAFYPSGREREMPPSYADAVGKTLVPPPSGRGGFDPQSLYAAQPLHPTFSDRRSPRYPGLMHDLRPGYSTPTQPPIQPSAESRQYSLSPSLHVGVLGASCRLLTPR